MTVSPDLDGLFVAGKKQFDLEKQSLINQNANIFIKFKEEKINNSQN